MRTVVLIASLIATSTHAEITAAHIDTCEKWGGLAWFAMQANQDRKPLADQMRLSPDPRAYEIIVMAYQVPRSLLPKMKEAEAADFRDRITSECLASLSGSEGSRPAEFWKITPPP